MLLDDYRFKAFEFGIGNFVSTGLEYHPLPLSVNSEVSFDGKDPSTLLGYIAQTITYQFVDSHVYQVMQMSKLC